jgi:hypothetical protein
MTMDVPTDLEEHDGEHELRDAAKLVIEHPLPIYDPTWLRRLHDRCLWDGGTADGPDFCSSRCAERYAEWEYRTTHVIVGREPLQTFVEHGMVNP